MAMGDTKITTLDRSLFDNISDGLAYCQMIFDTQRRPVDWIYVKVNKNFKKLTGLKDVAGRKATELMPGINASNPELLEIYGRVALGGKSEIFETYIELLSRWFSVLAYSPKKGFFVAVFQNITQQKQIEKELENAKIAARNVMEDIQSEKEMLAEAKAKDEALLQSIGDGLIATDKDGKILMTNKTFEELVGWKEEEVAGKSMVEVIPKQDEAGNIVPFKERILTRVLAGEKFSTTTTTTTTTTFFYYIRKDGTRFPASSLITPIMREDKIIGAVEVFRDMTKEKEIEKVRQDFLTLASHQLRTPLSGTKWLIETMQRGVIGKITQKQGEYLDELYKINERMIRLVFTMLNALRLESGAAVVEKETISISHLYEELSLMMESAAKARGVILRNALKNHKTVIVETDLIMLRNILECFISNAINYSNSGQEVILDAKEETSAFIFFVKDFGIGIPKEEQKRILERFYRASNAKIFKPDGTGLGLYITSMLAEKIGAEVLFDSEESKGSTFYLRVPKSIR